jgi:hypothetical protein
MMRAPLLMVLVHFVCAAILLESNKLYTDVEAYCGESLHFTVEDVLLDWPYEVRVSYSAKVYEYI